MIIGKNIDLRKIQPSDAEFILSLRLDPNLNEHLSYVEDDLAKQREWIINSNNNNEYYFIIQNKIKEPIGSIRIYNIEGNKFCWGSWIVLPKARLYASFESAVLLYKYAFYDLGLNVTNFDVRKDNDKTVKFHLRFGAVIINSNEQDYFFTYSKETFLAHVSEYDEVINKIALRQ